LSKILIISPTPTHPPNAGNRRGILSLANNLRLQRFDTYLLLLEYETGDRKQMQEWWGNKIFYFDYNMLFGKKEFMHRAWQKFHRLIRNLKKYFGKIVGRYSEHDILYNSFIDENYPDGLTPFVRELQGKYQFDAVIVTYVFLSKAFLAFEKKLPKVLDTHDIFSNRYAQFLEIGQKPSWISFFPSEEKKGFDRADMILSVQQNEIAFIKKLGVKKQILHIGHTIHYDPVLPENEDTLLFVASHNAINIDAINVFIANVFPKVKSKLPQCKLLIAGNICTVENEIVINDGVEFLGVFDNIRDTYARGYIVICPLRTGTGIKVKLLEALAFGKPCVVTPAAAEGLEKYSNKFFLVGESYEEQAEKILALFSCRDKYVNIAMSLKNFCDEYNASSELNTLFEFLKSYN
jgi:glycosyltransferase involved in cell wall biosynthesis